VTLTFDLPVPNCCTYVTYVIKTTNKKCGKNYVYIFKYRILL